MQAYIVEKKPKNINKIVVESRNQLFRKRYKISIEEQKILYKKLQEIPGISSRELVKSVDVVIKISVGQLNRIRKEWELNCDQGRPANKKEIKETEVASPQSHIQNIGLLLFSYWLKTTKKYDAAQEMINLQIEAHKQNFEDEKFRLLNAKEETIAKKWQAIMLLPLLGIEKISELDYSNHHCELVLGYSYSSSSLTQFLGELERVNAHIPINDVLSANTKGEYCYIDGHTLAFWSRRKVHKGLVTMLGRIMAGSNAVLAHDEHGEAIWLEYYPLDIHMTNVVEKYCSAIVEKTGIRQFIIDREVNSVEIARMFVEKKWELICLLDSNQYKGLDCFCKTFSKELSDGTKLYKATWNKWQEDDPRHFIIAQEQDRCIVYWCTPNLAKKLTAEEIIILYRQRSDIQENSIKHMIAHGALNTNYGTKIIIGPDRSHQRKLDKIDLHSEKLQRKKQKIEQSINIQNEKIRESQQKEHPKRLQTRVDKFWKLLEQKQDIQSKIEYDQQLKQQWGEPGQRADRDFRKQTIMTFRTLLLENWLNAFILLITSTLNKPIGVGKILKLFFACPGFVTETESSITYWFEPHNISSQYEDILNQLIDGFNQVSLVFQGKHISAQFFNST